MRYGGRICGRAIWAALLVEVLLCAGCFLPVALMPSEDAATAIDAKQHDAELRAFGLDRLEGPLADKLREHFVIRQAVDRGGDAPILIAGGMIDSLSESQAASILAAYRDHTPIVVWHVTRSELKALGAKLGFQWAHMIGAERDYAQYCAFDLEPDGHQFSFMQYPDSANPDGQVDENVQTHMLNQLVTWLAEDQHRDIGCGLLDAQSKAAQDKPNLLDLSSAHVKTKGFSFHGHHSQVSLYAFPLHSLSTDEDWIYIRAVCQFSAAGCYRWIQNVQLSALDKSLPDWTFSDYIASMSGADAAFFYTKNASVNAWIDGFVGESSLEQVSLEDSSPKTANNTEEVTQGTTFSIGGKLSFNSAGAAAGEISTGLQIKDEHRFTVHDCDVYNECTSQANNAQWEFHFNKLPPEWTNWIGWASVAEPPPLAKTTLVTYQSWLWRCDPAVRDRYPHYLPVKIELTPTIEGAFGMRVWGWPWSGWLKTTSLTGTHSDTIDIPWAPENP